MTNGINFGSTAFGNAMLGSSQVAKIYLGASLVWQKAVVEPAYRYIRWTGYGDQTGAITRLVELQYFDSTGNLIAGATPLSNTPVDGGATISAVTDGVTTSASGNYPYWNATGCTVVFDLSASKTLTKLAVFQYSTTADPRQTRFILEGSNDNSTWTTITDQSTSTVNGDTTNGKQVTWNGTAWVVA